MFNRTKNRSCTMRWDRNKQIWLVIYPLFMRTKTNKYFLYGAKNCIYYIDKIYLNQNSILLYFWWIKPKSCYPKERFDYPHLLESSRMKRIYILLIKRTFFFFLNFFFYHSKYITTSTRSNSLEKLVFFFFFVAGIWTPDLVSIMNLYLSIEPSSRRQTSLFIWN